MKKHDIFMGVVFLALAIMVIMSGMGYLGGISIPAAALTVIFGALIIDGIFKLEFTKILFSIAFICIIYDKQLHIEELTPWPVLIAALLGSIGLSMIFGKNRWKEKKIEFFNDNRTSHGATIDQVDGEQIRLSTTFGGSDKYITSDNLESVSIHCSFAGMAVYFDNAKIPSGRAVVDLDVSFAGLELYIPREWKVINDVRSTFGAVDNHYRSESTETPVLVLTGTSKFAGIDIMYV